MSAAVVRGLDRWKLTIAPLAGDAPSGAESMSSAKSDTDDAGRRADDDPDAAAAAAAAAAADTDGAHGRPAN